MLDPASLGVDMRPLLRLKFVVAVVMCVCVCVCVCVSWWWQIWVLRGVIEKDVYLLMFYNSQQSVQLVSSGLALWHAAIVNCSYPPVFTQMAFGRRSTVATCVTGSKLEFAHNVLHRHSRAGVLMTGRWKTMTA